MGANGRGDGIGVVGRASCSPVDRSASLEVVDRPPSPSSCEARAKSAASIQLTVVDGPVDDHLEEEKVAVSVPPSPEAPGQGASQPPRQ